MSLLGCDISDNYRPESPSIVSNRGNGKGWVLRGTLQGTLIKSKPSYFRVPCPGIYCTRVVCVCVCARVTRVTMKSQDDWEAGGGQIMLRICAIAARGQMVLVDTQEPRWL